MTNAVLVLGVAFAIAAIIGIALLVRGSIRESIDDMEEIIGDYPYTGGRSDD